MGFNIMHHVDKFYVHPFADVSEWHAIIITDISLISYTFQCKGLSFDGRVIKSDVTEKVINLTGFFCFRFMTDIYYYTFHR